MKHCENGTRMHKNTSISIDIAKNRKMETGEMEEEDRKKNQAKDKKDTEDRRGERKWKGETNEVKKEEKKRKQGRRQK